MVIQMIPMVVGDNKVVDARHVFGFVNFAAGKGFVGEADRGGLAEHGINQESFPFVLDQIGRMPEPDEAVQIGVEPVQIGLDGFYRHRRLYAGRFREYEFPELADEVAFEAVGRSRDGMQVLELAVLVVGGFLDSRQAFAFGQLSEAGTVHEEGDADSCCRDYS